MDNVPLLTELFNRSLSAEKLELPPNRTAECRSAEASCEQCLANTLDDSCKSNASASSPNVCALCSRRQCFAQPDCRRSLQPSCAAALPVCARGDVARVTLQPVFASIRSEFRCPVQFVQRRRQTDESVTLFRLQHSVSVPQLAFSSALMHDSVTSVRSKSSLLAESGSANVAVFELDYKLNLDGLSKLDQSVDFVLVGRLLNDSKYALQLERIKSASKWSRQHAVVADNQMIVALVQPRKPFGISTSTWMRNFQNCHQSIDQLFAHQDMFDAAESAAINSNDLRVEQLRTLPDEASQSSQNRFLYTVTSKSAFPSITFRLPGKLIFYHSFFFYIFPTIPMYCFC